MRSSFLQWTIKRSFKACKQNAGYELASNYAKFGDKVGNTA